MAGTQHRWTDVRVRRNEPRHTTCEVCGMRRTEALDQRGYWQTRYLMTTSDGKRLITKRAMNCIARTVWEHLVSND